MSTPAWFKALPAVQALAQFEANLACARLANEPDGCGLWVSPWPATAPRPPAGFPIEIGLTGTDVLAGAYRCSSTLWPIADGALAYVVLQHVLEFVVEPEELLAEAARALRGHGQLLLFGLRPMSWARLRGNWRNSPTRWTAATNWVQVCRALGLSDIKVTRFAVGWPSVTPESADWLNKTLPSLGSAYVLSARRRGVRMRPVVRDVRTSRLPALAQSGSWRA